MWVPGASTACIDVHSGREARNPSLQCTAVCKDGFFPPVDSAPSSMNYECHRHLEGGPGAWNASGYEYVADGVAHFEPPRPLVCTLRRPKRVCTGELYVPNALPRGCQIQNRLDNGTFPVTGQECIAQCKHGFFESTSAVYRCSEAGEWVRTDYATTSSEFRCIPDDERRYRCSAAIPDKHRHFVGCNVSAVNDGYADGCDTVCHEGYQPEQGDSFMICDAVGHWVNRNPSNGLHCARNEPEGSTTGYFLSLLLLIVSGVCMYLRCRRNKMVGRGTKAPRTLTISFADLEQLTPIASGAYGTVYKGAWTAGGKTVALKTVVDSARSSGAYTSNRVSAITGFEQEIEFHEGLVHPHIVQCLGHTRGVFPPSTREQNALVMEYIPLTLHQRLHCDDWQSTTEARYSIASGIVSGMIFMHICKKMAHLDLKSHNILMDLNRPKIADFGLTQATVTNGDD